MPIKSGGFSVRRGDMPGKVISRTCVGESDTTELITYEIDGAIEHITLTTSQFMEGENVFVQSVTVNHSSHPTPMAYYAPQVTQAKLFHILQLFSFILDQRCRDRVFEPAFEDLKQQFIEAKRYRKTLARSWIWFAFRFRMAWLIAGCVWEMMKASVLRCVVAAIPGAISRWWWS